MKEQDRILKHISLIKNKDIRVVKSIAYHPIFFAKKVMTDPDDYKPVRIRYFGVFVQKYMRNKDMYKKLSYVIKCIKKYPKLIEIFVDPSFSNDLEARKYINMLFDENNKEALAEIYDVVYKAIGDQ